MRKSLGHDLFENILRVLKGDKALKCAPIRIANKLIDGYKAPKADREYDKRKVDLKTNEEKDIDDVESIPDISPSIEIDKISQIDRWLNSIEDSKDREIAKLRYIEEKPVRKIEEILQIPKSTIHDRLKKLKRPD